MNTNKAKKKVYWKATDVKWSEYVIFKNSTEEKKEWESNIYTLPRSLTQVEIWSSLKFLEQESN